MTRPLTARPRTAAAPHASHRNGHIAVPAPRGRVRRIVTVTDKKAAVLRARSRPVPQVDASIRRLVADMAVTMRRAQGVGLAAPQIGVPLRVLVADTGRGLLALVNPRLRRRSGAQVGEEGCLSIPGVVAPVRRALNVTVDGTLVTGQRVGLRASGYIARILQHEIDHLNGVLFLDRVRAPAIRRRPLRSGERRRGAKSAAPAVLPRVSTNGRGPRRSSVRRAEAARRPERGRRPQASQKTAAARRPDDPWAGSALVVSALPSGGASRRPASTPPVSARS